MSQLGEVVVEVQADGGGEEVPVQPAAVHVGVLVRDPVLPQGAVHEERGARVLPGVAAGVRVVAHVAMQHLLQRLLRTHLGEGYAKKPF